MRSLPWLAHTPMMLVLHASTSAKQPLIVSAKASRRICQALTVAKPLGHTIARAIRVVTIDDGRWTMDALVYRPSSIVPNAD